MSRIAPDIPEPQRVPEAARSLVYVRALLAANRSPVTWVTGAFVFAAALAVGARLGNTVGGAAGAVLGTALGAAAAVSVFFKVILPWRARRLVPSVIDQADGGTLDDVHQTDENIRRMVDAYNRREGRGGGDR